MALIKFVIYASALIVFLGILSEEDEVTDELKKLLKEFEPNIKKIIFKIDEVLSDHNNMDLSKFDRTLNDKIETIQNKLNIIDHKKFDENTRATLKRLKAKIVEYEKKYKNKKPKKK